MNNMFRNAVLLFLMYLYSVTVAAGDIADKVGNIDAGEPSECAPGINSNSPDGPANPQSDPHRGNPIHVGSGNKYHSETVFRTSTEFPIEYAIHYNSRHIQPDDVTGRWTTSYSQNVFTISTLTPTSALSKIELFRPDGQVVSFPVGTLNHVSGPIQFPTVSVGYDKRIQADGTIELPGSSINNIVNEGDLVALSNTSISALVNGSWRTTILPNLTPYRVTSVSANHVTIKPARGTGWPAFSEAYTKANMQIHLGTIANGVTTTANYEASGEVRYSVSSLTIDPAALGYTGGGLIKTLAYTDFEYTTPDGYVEQYDYRGLLTSVRSPEGLEQNLSRTIRKYDRGFIPYLGDYVCAETNTAGQCAIYSNINYLNWTCKDWVNKYPNSPQLEQKCRLYGHVTAECNEWNSLFGDSWCAGYEDIKEGYHVTVYDMDVVLSDQFGNQISWSEKGSRREGSGGVCEGCTDTLVTPVGNYVFERSQGMVKKVIDPNNRVREFLYEISDSTYEGGCSPFWNCRTALTGILDEEGVRYASWDYLNYTQAKPNSNVHMARAYKSYHGTDDEIEDFYEIEYAPHDRIVTDDQGRAQTLHFTAGDGFVRLDTASGAGGTNCKTTATSYSYNAKQQISKIAYDGKFTYDYTYYPDGRIESITEAKGTDLERKAVYDWKDSSGRKLRSVMLYEGAKEIQFVEFFYWPNGRLKQRSITDRTNLTTPYSTFGRKLVTDYLYEYHTGAKVRSITIDGPRSDVADITKLNFNTKGQLASVTNAAGHLIGFEDYNSAGMPGRVVDENGVASTVEFNLRGQLTKLNLAESSLYDLVYYKNGLLKTIIYPEGETITYEYTSARKLKTVIDKAGNRIEISRSIDATDPSLRNVITLIKDHLGQERFAEKIQLDALGRAYKWFGENDRRYVDEFGYDTQGNLTNYLNGGVYNSTATIDKLGRVDTVTASDDGATTIKYNALDQVTSVKDPRNLSTIYTVDGFGRVIQQSSPDTGISVFHYDAAGNRTKVIDAAGKQTDYRYDGLNRLTNIIHTGDQGHSIFYRYDETANGNYGKGRLTSSGIVNGTGRYSLVYDKKGLLREKQIKIGGRVYAWSYEYDGSGNVAAIRYPSGRLLTYSRSQTRRLAQVVSTYSGVDEVIARDITYEPFGPLKSFYFGNGVKHETVYNKAYWPVGVEDTQIQKVGWAYYNTGLLRQTDIQQGSGEDTTYYYDDGARLEHVVALGWSTEFGYDLSGNRELKRKTDSSAGTTRIMTTVVDPLSNRIKPIIETHWKYSDTGQLEAKPATGDVYTYGDNGRLSAYQGLSASGEYEYGPFGERLVKRSAGTEIHYVYEGPDLLAEFDASSGKVLREYFYADGKLVSMYELTDRDGDGMDDGWEKVAFGDLSHGTSTDADGDGVPDSEEYQSGSDALNSEDMDGDMMADDWERHFFGTLDRDGSGDFDKDGTTDLAEYQRKSKPTLNDIAWLIPILHLMMQ